MEARLRQKLTIAELNHYSRCINWLTNSNKKKAAELAASELQQLRQRFHQLK
jgi:hypothetical protein